MPDVEENLTDVACTLILTISSEAFPPLALFVPNWNALVNITISPVRPLILWCFDLDPLSRLHKNRTWFSSKGAGKTSGIGGRLRTGRETNWTHSNPAWKQHTNSNRGVQRFRRPPPKPQPTKVRQRSQAKTYLRTGLLRWICGWIWIFRLLGFCIINK